MGQQQFADTLSFYPLLLLSFIWCIAVQGFLLRTQQAALRVCIGVISAMFGLLLGLSYGHQALERRLMEDQQHNEQVSVVVYINKINQLSPSQIRQQLQVLNVGKQPQTWSTAQPINLEHANKALTLGHYYQIQGERRSIDGYANLGGFDQKKWAIQQGIVAQLKIDHVQVLTSSEVESLGLGHHLRQHQHFTAKFLRYIEHKRLALRHFIQAQPVQHKGLLLALVSGDESLLQPEIEQLFQRFGLSHLLAISGPHVLIFAMICCVLLQQILQHYCPQIYLKYPRQKLLLLPFNACVVLYCAFVGFEIPALRTLFLSLTLSTCILINLKLSSFKMLLISASVLLIIDPFSVLSAAFWLSYTACFILLRIYETVQQQSSVQGISHIQKIKQTALLLVESQWKIFVALLPLMLIFFQQVTWISPFANLIAIPLIGLVIVPFDILTALCFFVVPPLATVLIQINDLIVGLLLWMLNTADHIFQPQLQRFAMDFTEMTMLILALVLLFLPRGVIPKAWVALCALPFIFPYASRHAFELNILDVGQGQSVFIRDGARTMLLDVGGYYDETKFSVGERIILPYLSRKSVSSLDEVWLSHLDQDHSGALPQVQRLPIKSIISNEQPQQLLQSQFEYCQQAQPSVWSKQITIKVLSPLSEQLKDVAQQRNEYSCVLLLEVQTAERPYTFLMMGDAGWQTEYRLMQDYPNLKVDVLVLGHHGSRHSSSYDFLQHVEPKMAVVSAGLNNRYGHPSPAVVARLADLNIPLLQTSQLGTIQFKHDENQQMQWSAYRNGKRWLKPQADGSRCAFCVAKRS